MRVKQARYTLAADGEQTLTLLLSGNCQEECQQLERKLDGGKEINVIFQNDKRSLDANAYYWTLVGKIAKVIGASLSEVHNTMLRRYGVPLEVGGSLTYAFLPDTEEVEKSTLNSETFHLRPTSNVRPGKGDVDYRAYLVMKGSSVMTTDEMSALIDGTLSECRDMGLPTGKPWES